MSRHLSRIWPKAAALAAVSATMFAVAPSTPAAAGPRSAAADVARPVDAPNPDPFNGGVPGDVSAGNGALAPAQNPPSASPVIQNALPGAHLTQTRFGSIDDVDRLFLIKVRQAGLWERPTCLRAQQQAQSPRLREICQTLASDHAALDEEDRFISRQLNVGIPDQPSVDQQAWMREFWLLQGHEFDVDAVRWLRFAHGQVFTAIAQVRAGTRNDMMRLFAERANAMVNKHMSLLESTGLVEYDALPRAGIGAAAAGLANAKIPTLDSQANHSQRDIDRTLGQKSANLLQPSTIALIIVATLLTVVSIRRVVKGGS